MHAPAAVIIFFNYLIGCVHVEVEERGTGSVQDLWKERQKVASRSDRSTRTKENEEKVVHDPLHVVYLWARPVQFALDVQNTHPPTLSTSHNHNNNYIIKNREPDLPTRRRNTDQPVHQPSTLKLTESKQHKNNERGRRGGTASIFPIGLLLLSLLVGKEEEEEYRLVATTTSPFSSLFIRYGFPLGNNKHSDCFGLVYSPLYSVCESPF